MSSSWGAARECPISSLEPLPNWMKREERSTGLEIGWPMCARAQHVYARADGAARDYERMSPACQCMSA